MITEKYSSSNSQIAAGLTETLRQEPGAVEGNSKLVAAHAKRRKCRTQEQDIADFGMCGAHHKLFSDTAPHQKVRMTSHDLSLLSIDTTYTVVKSAWKIQGTSLHFDCALSNETNVLQETQHPPQAMRNAKHDRIPGIHTSDCWIKRLHLHPSTLSKFFELARWVLTPFQCLSQKADGKAS